MGGIIPRAVGIFGYTGSRQIRSIRQRERELAPKLAKKINGNLLPISDRVIGLTQNRVFLQQLTADGRPRSVVGGQILGVLRKS
jgi:hypothetical protein